MQEPAPEASDRRKRIRIGPQQTTFDASLLSSWNDFAGVRRELFSPQLEESMNFENELADFFAWWFAVCVLTVDTNSKKIEELQNLTGRGKDDQ